MRRTETREDEHTDDAKAKIAPSGVSQANRHTREEPFRFFIDGVEDYAIFMLDQEGRVATWNAGAQRAKGYKASEIIGRHFSVFYSEEDRRAEKPKKLLEIATKEGRVSDEGLARPTGRDGFLG